MLRGEMFEGGRDVLYRDFVWLLVFVRGLEDVSKMLII